MKSRRKPQPSASSVPPPREPDEVLAARRAKAEEKRTKAEREGLEAHLEELRARLDAFTKVRELTRLEVAAPVPKFGKGAVHTRRAVAVAVASDWHVEEVVDPRKVQGMNEYNPIVAEVRAQRFFEGIAWLVREQRHMFEVRQLALFLLGDLITGYIHEELLESNAMSPSHAVIFVKRLISQGLRYLLKELPEFRIHVTCHCGNHGRTTQKLRIATAVQNSWEWLLYRMLADEFYGEKRVTWHIAEGHHSVTTIAGMRVHAHHGDSVRSNGGVGGIEVPLNRSRLQWHTKYKADISLVGHFHQYLSGEKLVVNGSLIGYGTYSDWLASAAPEPPRQAFFLIDSKRGKCQSTPIWCGKDDK